MTMGTEGQKTILGMGKCHRCGEPSRFSLSGGRARTMSYHCQHPDCGFQGLIRSHEPAYIHELEKFKKAPVAAAVAAAVKPEETPKPAAKQAFSMDL